jgi:hypothetical protein
VKAEAPCARLDDRLLLAGLPPDPLVLGQDHPGPTASLSEPDLVIGVLVEQLVVGNDVDVGIRLAQAVGNLPATQASVDEDLRRLALRGSAPRP